MSTTVPEPCEVLVTCPLCGGEMQTEYQTREHYTCSCKDCKTTVTVPKNAWSVLRTKRAAAGQ